MDAETCPDFDPVDRARFARAVQAMQHGPHVFLPGVAWRPCTCCFGTGEARFYRLDGLLGPTEQMGMGVCPSCSGHGVIAWAPRRG